MRRRLLLASSALVAATSTPLVAQDFGVTLDPILLGTALRDDRALLDTPVAASVRDEEDLANTQASTFEDLVGDIPGVTIGGGPRGISQEPNIRGFTDDQIVLRFDGGRFNFGQAHRGRFFVDPSLVRRVEVVRGGGSTLFGSGALGGVIAVETLDAADLLEPGQTQGGRVTLGWSSNGEIPNAMVTVFADYGAVDILASVAARQVTADLDSGNGAPIPFSQIDTLNGMVKLGFEVSPDSRVEFSLSQYRDSALVPSNSNAAPAAGNPIVDRDADVQDLRLTWDFAPQDAPWIDLSVLFYGTRLDITEFRVPPGAPRLDQTRYDTFGLEVVNRSSFDLGVPVDLVYGFETFRDTQEGLRNGAPRTAFPDAGATTTGIFAEATWGIGERLDLITGLRFDTYRRDPNDPALAEVDEDFVSPRIGFSFRPTQDWQVFGNVSQAYRAPSLTELYNSGLHFPGVPPAPPFFPGFPNNFFVPNPNLLPEESLQIEIGARLERAGMWRSGDMLTVAVNAYQADVKNYIESVVNVAAGTTTNANVDARLWGFEAEVAYDAQDWFLGSGLSIARGERAAGGALGSVPADRLTLQGGLRPWSDWELGARATLAAAQTRVPAGGTPSASYRTFDLYASFAPESGPLAGTVFRLGVDNVFDEQYIIYPNALPQEGRSIKLSATFSF